MDTGQEALLPILGGRIDNFLVPRARRKVKFRLIKAYQRRVEEFDYAIFNCFLNGSSTRRTAHFFLESSISHQTVSNILKRLDSLVNQFLKKRLTDDYLFLIVEAKYTKIKLENKRRRPVIFAMGIEEDLFDLKDKGLGGNKLKMLICDGKRCIKNVFYLYTLIKISRFVQFPV